MTPLSEHPRSADDLICQVESEDERLRAEQAEADELADCLAEYGGVYCLATVVPALLRWTS
jgi:hypothetical protein